MQVHNSYYLTSKYLSLERFINYYCQISNILNISPKNILFIGVGDNIVPYILKRKFDVTTLDFDNNLRPDICGDIRNLPFLTNINKRFDLVCLFEVLEHISYAEMEEVLKFLSLISDKILISVPHRRTGFEIILKFPFARSLISCGFLRFAMRIPLRFKGFKESGQHYWEIDGINVSLNKFRKSVEKYFKIEKEFTPPLDMYRRFFLTKVMSKNVS